MWSFSEEDTGDFVVTGLFDASSGKRREDIATVHCWSNREETKKKAALLAAAPALLAACIRARDWNDACDDGDENDDWSKIMTAIRDSIAIAEDHHG